MGKTTLKSCTESLIRGKLYAMSTNVFVKLWNDVYADGCIDVGYIYNMRDFTSKCENEKLSIRDIVKSIQNNKIDLEDTYFILSSTEPRVQTFDYQDELEEELIAPFIKYLYFLDSNMYDDFPKGTEELVKILKNSKQKAIKDVKTIKDVAETIFGEDAPLFNLCPDGLVEEKIDCDKYCPNCKKCLEEFWNRPYIIEEE